MVAKNMTMSETNLPQIKVKVAYNGDIMVTYIDQFMNIESLSREMIDICRFPEARPFTMKWIDDEGDPCTLSTQNELEEALRLYELNEEADMTILVFPGVPEAPGCLCPGEDKNVYRRGAKRWRKLYRINGHLFQLKRFSRKAICVLCNERIWGLGRQGLKCINCKLLIHKKCHKNVRITCTNCNLTDSASPDVHGQNGVSPGLTIKKENHKVATKINDTDIIIENDAAEFSFLNTNNGQYFPNGHQHDNSARKRSQGTPYGAESQSTHPTPTSTRISTAGLEYDYRTPPEIIDSHNYVVPKHSHSSTTGSNSSAPFSERLLKPGTSPSINGGPPKHKISKPTAPLRDITQAFPIITSTSSHHAANNSSAAKKYSSKSNDHSTSAKGQLTSQPHQHKKLSAVSVNGGFYPPTSASPSSLHSIPGSGALHKICQSALMPDKNIVCTPRKKKSRYQLSDFELIKVIGRGSYAKVFLAELRETKKVYAMKVIKKELINDEEDVDWVQTEKHVFETATNHPFLVGLHSCFQTTSRLIFVIEFVNGGDLMFHMQRQRRLPEDHSRFYSAEIILALNFLHRKGIIYRDLKLDNVLLDAEGHIRLTDYGMCKEGLGVGDRTSTFCGTPNYIAPEILRGDDYGFSVDWWALGVLMFEMLAGRSPFDIVGATDNPDHNTEDYLFQVILEKTIRIPRSISVKSASVLKGFLNKDPRERLGCHPETGFEDIVNHCFFKTIDWEMLENKQLTPPYKPKLTSDRAVDNFDPQFTNEPAILTPDEPSVLERLDQGEFENFEYVNPLMN